MKAIITDGSQKGKVVHLTESKIDFSGVFPKDAKTGAYRMTEASLAWVKTALRESRSGDDDNYDFNTNVDFSDFTAIRHSGSTTMGYSVLVRDKKNDMEQAIDVWVDDNDLQTDWSSFIFHRNNPEDMRSQAYQKNAEFYEYMTSAATEYLADKGLIKQSPDGEWSCSNSAKRESRGSRQGASLREASGTDGISRANSIIDDIASEAKKRARSLYNSGGFDPETDNITELVAAAVENATSSFCRSKGKTYRNLVNF